MAKTTLPDAQTSPRIDTQPLRRYLAAISAHAMIGVEGAPPEITMKMSGAMVSLTKAICEAEAHNLKCGAAEGESAAGKDGFKNASLGERLKGYSPTKKELQDIEATLRRRLDTLAPRLAADAANPQSQPLRAR